jgi:hypothetical protein
VHNAYNAKAAYSAASETSALASDTILRRNPPDRDVRIEILFCGIFHDLHQVHSEWVATIASAQGFRRAVATSSILRSSNAANSVNAG